MRRSVLVKVPSFSTKLAAGKITSANWRGLAREDFLQDHELGAAHRIMDVVKVRVARHRIFADDVQRPYLLGRAPHDFHDCQPDLVRERHAPGLLELLLGPSLLTPGRPDRLGQPPMSQAPWTLFCPRSGLTPPPGRRCCRRSMGRLAQLMTLSTPAVCWVIPMA